MRSVTFPSLRSAPTSSSTLRTGTAARSRWRTSTSRSRRCRLRLRRARRGRHVNRAIPSGAWLPKLARAIVAASTPALRPCPRCQGAQHEPAPDLLVAAASPRDSHKVAPLSRRTCRQSWRESPVGTCLHRRSARSCSCCLCAAVAACVADRLRPGDAIREGDHFTRPGDRRGGYSRSASRFPSVKECHCAGRARER